MPSGSARRFDDRDEGSECDAGPGLRLWRAVLRRSDLEPRQLATRPHPVNRPSRVSRGGLNPSTFIWHSAGKALNRETAAASSIAALIPAGTPS